MRLAVITPYYQETDDQLARCHDSVIRQQNVDVRHFMIADGWPKTYCQRADIEHLILPTCHRDAGATPRSIAAISAFSQGYDAIAFLDADCWYEPVHLELMTRTLNHAAADAVVATRSIYDSNNDLLYVDRVESNGVNMVDTNCMFLTRRALPFLAAWITEKKHALISDRIFWQACLTGGLRMIRCDNPTVGYVTKWAWHYQYANKPIPPNTVWLDQDSDGNYIHITNANRER